MGKTRRQFAWSRCPKPDCEGSLGINGDGEIEEWCGICGTEDYTDAEYDIIWANVEYPDADEEWPND